MLQLKLLLFLINGNEQLLRVTTIITTQMGILNQREALINAGEPHSLKDSLSHRV
jgi:hypothetical protein